jgi:hypothetical protein
LPGLLRWDKWHASIAIVEDRAARHTSLMATLLRFHSFQLKFDADEGYQQPMFQEAIRRQTDVEIVKRFPHMAQPLLPLAKDWKRLVVRFRLLASRPNPLHAPQDLSQESMIPDGLWKMVNPQGATGIIEGRT